MKRLRLLRLASFSGYGIDVTQNEPVIEVEDDLAERLLATGYFEDLTPKGTTKVPAPEPQSENEKVPEAPQGEEVQATDEIESVAEPSEDMQEAPKSKGGRKK
ncbi:MAG TPA: hypothetical protein GXX40_05660 [Firmicutes bacterium]|nr:hypothetical protein [Bacillota bacterium]